MAQQAAVDRVRAAVESDYDLRRVEVVGPRVSGELVQSGTLGVVLAIIAVLGYLWFRFEWQFAVSAVIATMHDLLLTVGFFALTQLEFNTTSIAAILTIVGYSLNETVVVLDRIREMMRKYKKMSTAQIIDMSINAVLPRTIMTATTVLLALLSLAIFGGQVIRSFSLAMIWGLVVATYSSVFICSPMLIYLGLRNEGRSEAPAEDGETSVAALESAPRAGSAARAGRRRQTATPKKSGGKARRSDRRNPARSHDAGRGLRSGSAQDRRLWKRRVSLRRHVASRLHPRAPGGVRALPHEAGGDRRGDARLAIAEKVDLLIVGTGETPVPLPAPLRAKLRAAGVGCETMATGTAVRAYNMLVEVSRRLAALLIAV